MVKQKAIVNLAKRGREAERTSSSRLNWRARTSLLCVLVFTASFLSVVGTADGQPVYVDQAFTGPHEPNWTFLAGQGDPPFLTASDGTDASGSGWLRLTSDATDQSTFAYYNTPIPTKLGLKFEFDFVIWSETNRAIGDGFTLVIFDANVEPSPGGYGGSLGYAKRNAIEGLDGAVLGVGFDEFGNFSDSGEGRGTGPGRTNNSIAIRGSMGANRNEGYDYVIGTQNLTQADDPNDPVRTSDPSRPLFTNFATRNVANRDAATVHRVSVTITPTQRITLTLGTLDDQGNYVIEPYTLINNFPCTMNCPELVRFGFTAGTGNATGFHEIRNLQVSAATVPEPGTLALMVLGGVVGAGMYWRQRRFTTKSKAA